MPTPQHKSVILRLPDEILLRILSYASVEDQFIKPKHYQVCFSSSKFHLKRNDGHSLTAINIASSCLRLKSFVLSENLLYTCNVFDFDVTHVMLAFKKVIMLKQQSLMAYRIKHHELEVMEWATRVKEAWE